MEEKKTLKDGRTVTIRKPAEKDAEAFLEFMQELCATSPHLARRKGEFDLTVEQEASWLKTRAENGNVICLTAFDCDGNVVGNVVIEAMARVWKTDHRAALSMGVKEGWRGIGLGGVLMDLALEEAVRKESILQVELEVVAENKQATMLYSSRGFVTVGRIPRGMKKEEGGHSDLLMMVKSL